VVGACETKVSRREVVRPRQSDSNLMAPVVRSTALATFVW